MRIFFPVALLGLALPMMAQQQPQVLETIVARVNNDIVTLSELNKNRAQLQAELGQRLRGIELSAQVAEKEKDLLRDLVDNLLLVQKGKDLGLNVDTEMVKYQDKLRKDMNLASMEDLEKAVVAQGLNFEDWKANTRNEMIKRQVIGREVSSNIKVSQDEIKKFYDTNKDKMQRPEMVFLRELLISTENKTGPALEAAEKKAADVLAKAKKGDNFGELAAKESDADSAKNGGDIGGFERGKGMAKEIEDAVWSLKKGGVTDIIKVKTGLLILKVEEHTQAGIPPLADIEPQVQDQIYMERMQPALRTYLTKLRNEAYLEVRPGYTDSGAPETLSSAHLIPVDVSPEELTTTVAGAKKGAGKKVYKPWTWVGRSKSKS